jgi:hypothetical protein
LVDDDRHRAIASRPSGVRQIVVYQFAYTRLLGEAVNGQAASTSSTARRFDGWRSDIFQFWRQEELRAVLTTEKIAVVRPPAVRCIYPYYGAEDLSRIAHLAATCILTGIRKF